MKRRNILSAIALLLGTAVSLAQGVKQTANYRVVPLPQEINMKTGQGFTLNAQTRIAYPQGNETLKRDAQLLAEYLQTATRIRPALTTEMAGRNVIALSVGLNHANTEAYRLTVNKDRIVIAGASAAGTFYGIQTLRKAIPQTGAQLFTFPAVEITDYPRFGYRGAMLDVARHFFNVDEVKTFIDMLALHNINRFHWHLTDDQGWRIERNIRCSRRCRPSARRPSLDAIRGSLTGNLTVDSILKSRPERL